MFADHIGVALATVKDWQWVASRWSAGPRKEAVSFRKILASVVHEAERWVAIEDAPCNALLGRKQWTLDGAKRLFGQQVERPVTVDEKVRAVRDLTRDNEVTASLPSRSETPAALPVAHLVPAVKTCPGMTRSPRTSRPNCCSLPVVAGEAVRDDDTRFTVNRAQFDNSEEVHEKIRERVTTISRVEHPIEHLDLVAASRRYGAPLGGLVPRLRDQQLSDGASETVRRGIARARGAAD